MKDVTETLETLTSYERELMWVTYGPPRTSVSSEEHPAMACEFDFSEWMTVQLNAPPRVLVREGDYPLPIVDHIPHVPYYHVFLSPIVNDADDILDCIAKNKQDAATMKKAIAERNRIDKMSVPRSNHWRSKLKQRSRECVWFVYYKRNRIDECFRRT